MKNRNFLGGAYASAITAVVVILVIAVNLIASKMDLTVDLTKTKLFTLSEETEEFVKGLGDEIVLYYFVETGKEDELVNKLVKKYDGLGKNMKLEYVDPMLHPNFASSLVGAEEASSINDNSIVVVNKTNGRFRAVPYATMFLQSTDYNTGESEVFMDVEGQVDSALLYVTNEDLPVIYNVTGHQEIAVAESMKTLMSRNNVAIEDLELMTSEIPEDCSILLVNYPAYDYTVEETAKITEYLDAGGKAIFNIDYLVADMTNFNVLLNNYGVELVPGVIIENDSRYHVSGNPYALLPTIETHDIMDGVKGIHRVYASICSGLKALDDRRDSITLTELLKTSENSFSKVDLESSVTVMEEADVAGPMSVMLLMEETYQGVTSQLLVCSATGIWNEIIDSYGNDILTLNAYGNADLFVNCVNYLGAVESSFTVPTQNLGEQSTALTLTAAQVNINAIIKMAVLPLACLLTGAVILILRRRSS